MREAQVLDGAEGDIQYSVEEKERKVSHKV